jgi:hypothetical protein
MKNINIELKAAAKARKAKRAEGTLAAMQWGLTQAQAALQLLVAASEAAALALTTAHADLPNETLAKLNENNEACFKLLEAKRPQLEANIAMRQADLA